MGGLLLVVAPLAAQPDWKEWDAETWGPAARVEERRPHPACARCFTLPNHNPYAIYEYVASEHTDGARIIPRAIPNPAPAIKARADYDPEIGGSYDVETGERVWYIGTQGFVGPTDEERWSPDLPVSTIEMKRIQARHRDAIFRLEGVHSFGMGPYGFVVGVLPGTSEVEQARVPTSLEGVPVTVEERPRAPGAAGGGKIGTGPGGPADTSDSGPLGRDARQ